MNFSAYTEACFGNILEFMVANVGKPWKPSKLGGPLSSNKSNRDIMKALWTQ